LRKVLDIVSNIDARGRRQDVVQETYVVFMKGSQFCLNCKQKKNTWALEKVETSGDNLQAAARVPILMSCTLKLPVIISDKSFALPKLLPRDFAFCN